MKKMKVLWFAGTSGIYANDNSYNGGGWIGALQREIMKEHADELDFELAFPWISNFEEQRNGMKYYGIKRIHHAFINNRRKQENEYKRIKEIIDISAPDIIHVFGTERSYGMVCCMTDIPVVIHLQGILTSYYNLWMPQNLSWTDYILRNPKRIIQQQSLKCRVKLEREIMSNVKFLMGRTDWDKSTSALLAPQAQYFYCSEMLRSEIYNSEKTWHKHNGNRRRIVSIISGTPYKGGDVILRAAKELKLRLDNKFDWYVYGINDFSLYSNVSGIKPQDVNVHAGGVINASQLVDVVCECDVFVHPSYIENSPNTVCEAQLLGAPIVATNVGGVSTLIKDGESGLLIPGGDACMMASRIVSLLENPELCNKISEAGRKRALQRHNPQTIVNDLLYVYNSISNIKRPTL